MIHGCDLYHGDAMVDPSQFDFVFHKATQGTWFTDSTCQARLKMVRDAGKLAGMYHFMTTADPIHAQVEFFLEQGMPQRGDVLTLDFENDGSWANIAALDLAAMATRFMRELAESAEFHRTILYCNLWTYETIVQRFNVPTGDGLWIAQYSSEPQFGQRFWQYASDSVDRDEGYFTGLTEAKRWVDEVSQEPPASQQRCILLED